ncbi:hypothetical protein FEM54_13980 [Pseudomonas edaphica]|uniref:AraC family transcriptional regulator n=1 Tax=Pseudomonas edaphica TaxID=2006980 RepID=A0ABY2U564_9PSED|nr:hypothetical protein [Pseudomonas edaphica]TLG91253.1 hypothetical protein FEM54_13980 [Pseudomonas edaphica]
MINVTPTDTQPSLAITHHDFVGAQSWMTDICGPHQLSAKFPEKVCFDHAYHKLTHRGATIVGELCYGTEVDVSISEEALICYSLSCR